VHASCTTSPATGLHVQAAAISEEQPEDVHGWLAAWFAARAASSGSHDPTSAQLPAAPPACEQQVDDGLQSVDGERWIPGTGLTVETRAEGERRVQQGSATSGAMPPEESPGGTHWRSEDAEGAPLIEKAPGANSVFISFDSLGGVPPAIRKYRDEMLRRRAGLSSNSTSPAPVCNPDSPSKSQPHLQPLRSGFLTSAAGLDDGSTPPQQKREPRGDREGFGAGGGDGSACDDGEDGLVEMLANGRVQLEELARTFLEADDGGGGEQEAGHGTQQASILRARLEEEVGTVRQLLDEQERVRQVEEEQEEQEEELNLEAAHRRRPLAPGADAPEGGGGGDGELRDLVGRDRAETQQLITELEDLLRARWEEYVWEEGFARAMPEE